MFGPLGWQLAPDAVLAKAVLDIRSTPSYTHDEIARAQRERTLWRNFQGYTTHAGVDLYALGVSAIAQIDDAYVQNTKDYAAYHAACAEGRPSTVKGHRLSAEDQMRRTVITNLLCHCVIKKREIEAAHGLGSFDETFASELDRLEPLIEDGLVEPRTDEEIRVTALGRMELIYDLVDEKKLVVVKVRLHTRTFNAIILDHKPNQEKYDQC